MALFSRTRRLRTTTPQGDALLASASRVTSAEAGQYRRLTQAWHRDAFRYYHILGECWYPTQFYAKALSKLRVYAGRRDEQGEVKESLPDTWEARELSRLQDPGGGTSQLFTNYGRLWFLIGETYLLGQDDPDGEECWEFLSPSELRYVEKDTYARYTFPGANPEDIPVAPDDDFEPLPDAAVVYRFYNPDPEYSKLGDSPIRSVLPLFQQLELLEATFNARLKSRLAASGILLVADELSFGTPDGQNDDDPKTDPFMQMLQQAMLRPIREPGSASQVAPIMLRIPASMIADDSAMKHIQIHDPKEVIPELDQWEKVVARLAVGLDMPPEILVGMGDANRWSAFQIDDTTWTAHLQPVAQSLVDNLGSAFLRPLARQQGIEYAAELVVGYDAAEIINHPDRTKDAKDVHDRGALSDESLRTATGFSDEDAPTPEEQQRFLLIKLRGQAAALELQNLGTPSTTPQTLAEPTVPQTLTQEALQNEESVMSASVMLVGRVLGAAEAAAERSRERAGGRIITAARRPGGCQECAERVQNLPNALVASVLGQEAVTELGLSAGALVAGGADGLRRMLPEWGVPEPVASRVAMLVEKHAAASLYEPTPLPANLIAFVEATLRNGS